MHFFFKKKRNKWYATFKSENEDQRDGCTSEGAFSKVCFFQKCIHYSERSRQLEEASVELSSSIGMQ